MYYFADWKETQNGKAANLPENVGYAMLAEPSSLSDYALFECRIPDECEKPNGTEPVSPYLHDLLESAKDYPPALALTRNDVRSNQVISKSEFAEQLVARLEFHLQHQRISPYFMARKINTYFKWNSKGGFYWIIGYNPQDTLGGIRFVSRDYCIYHAPIEEFDLEIEDIERQFVKPPLS